MDFPLMVWKLLHNCCSRHSSSIQIHRLSPYFFQLLGLVKSRVSFFSFYYFFGEPSSISIVLLTFCLPSKYYELPASDPHLHSARKHLVCRINWRSQLICLIVIGTVGPGPVLFHWVNLFDLYLYTNFHLCVWLTLFAKCVSLMLDAATTS